jgi:hypothetical protein
MKNLEAANSTRILGNHSGDSATVLPAPSDAVLQLARKGRIRGTIHMPRT